MKRFTSLFRSTLPQTGQQDAQGTLATYWSLLPEQLLSTLHATGNGLNPADVEVRLKQYGLNALEAQRKATALGLFLSQFKSPLVLILIGAAAGDGQALPAPNRCMQRCRFAVLAARLMWSVK